MRRRSRQYRLPATSGGGCGCFYWILVLILVFGLYWVWKQTRRSEPPRPAPAISRPQAAPALPPSALEPVERAVSTNVPPTVIRADASPPPPQGTLAVQIALARLAISPGSVDGVMGSQTRAAILAFQAREQLAATGVMDPSTRGRLHIEDSSLGTYRVTSNDLARLQPLAPTWLGKSEQGALEFETLLELVSERHHANPKLIRALNPAVNWSNSVPGLELRVPQVEYPVPAEAAAAVHISLSAKTVQALGARSNLLAHFPCSIAQRVEKRPVGELYVTAIAPNPNYTFDPDVFPESPEARTLGRKLILQPGPNNPVGVAWISLNLPGYGIHGTPHPELVGRTESHGCFRLANWDAEYLLKLVKPGTPVFVKP